MFTFFSCNINNAKKYEKRYGVEFNSERKKLKLPLLDSSWVVNNFEELNDSIIFLNYSSKKSIDSSAMVTKLVKLVNGNFYREENHFVGNKVFKTGDGLFKEELYISIYRNNINEDFKWDCEFRGIGKETGVSVNKIQADSILKQWNISTY